MAMSDRILYRLTAAGLMVGGVLFVLGLGLGAPPPTVAPTPQLLILTFAVLLMAGLPALYLRQREQAGVLGLAGVALAFVGVFLLAGMNYVWAFFVPGLAEAAPGVLERFPDGEWQRLIGVNVAGRLGLAAGLVVFGIATFRAAVLPRWAAALAALGGVGAIVQIVAVLLELGQPLRVAPALLLPVGLFGLGWGLWASTAEPPVRTARTARTVAVMTVAALLAGALAAAPAAADAPPQRFALPDEVFEGFNPCTGELDTVTVSDMVLTVHEFDDAGGGQHGTVRLSASVSTAAGFGARRENQVFMAHTGSGQSDLVVEHAVINVTAQGPDGQTLVGRVVAHLTVKGDEAVADFERFDFSCRGRPAD
jgi:hypothetical protein